MNGSYNCLDLIPFIGLSPAIPIREPSVGKPAVHRRGKFDPGAAHHGQEFRYTREACRRDVAFLQSENAKVLEASGDPVGPRNLLDAIKPTRKTSQIWEI
ncbi:hypothetical protein FRC01_014230, partial [Tulasnella sp. 417]